MESDLRRKRLLYRATHRGTKEADAVIGGFFQQNIAALPAAVFDEAEALLDVPDLDLMDWAMGRLPIPERWQGTLFDDVLRYYHALTKKNP